MIWENWFIEIVYFSDWGFGIIYFMIVFILFLCFECIVVFGVIGM